MFIGVLSCAISSGVEVLLTDDVDGDNDGFCVIVFVPLVSRSLKFTAKCFCCLFNGCCAIGFTTDCTADCVFAWFLSIDVFVVGDTIFVLPILSADVSDESFLGLVSCSSKRLL